MPKFDYADAANTALELIAEFGGTGKLVQYDGQSVDPITSVVIPGTLVQTDITLVFLPATNGTILGFEERLKQDFVSGKAKFVIVSAKGVPLPRIGDKLIADESGITYSVAGATPLDPAGTPVIYNIGLRQ
tara:strand:- start:89 stop:481 length:393 start_codon:yes stop_codon:yes gene_type:complete